jgi:hypothetical protein
MKISEKYPDDKIKAAIERAIAQCNRLVSTKEILWEYLGVTYTSKAFLTLPTEEKKYFSRRVYNLMKDHFPIYNQNSATVTWLVKP